MNNRQIGYVLVALIALGVLGILARLLATETEIPSLAGVSALTGETVDKVVMRDQEYETTIEKGSDGEWWRGPYPAVPLKLKEMWEIAAEFNGAELISTNPVNHRDMGVSSANATFVSFYSGGKLIEEFLIGDKVYAPVEEEEKVYTPWTTQSRLCYIRRPGNDETYGVVCETPQRFDADSKFWSEPIILRIPRDEIEAVTFKTPTGAFALVQERSVWYVIGPDGRMEADVDSVQALLREIEFLVTTEFPTDEEVKPLDFSNPDYELGVQTRMGATEKSVLLLLLAKGDGGHYIRDSDEAWVHYLDSEYSADLLVSKESLLVSPENNTTTEAIGTTTSDTGN